MVTGETHTRSAVRQLLFDEGALSAAYMAERLGLSPAAVRRHLDTLTDLGELEVVAPPRGSHRGRGRPPKLYRLSSAGHDGFGHHYDEVASAALALLHSLGGDAAVRQLATARIEKLTQGIAAAEEPQDRPRVAEQIAHALTEAGYSATTRDAGQGVQLCQHHCPIHHVAEEYPQFCEAEREHFAALLDTPVQPLATLTRGDIACTTNIPLTSVATASERSTS